MFLRIIKTSRPLLWLMNITSLTIGISSAGETVLLTPLFYYLVVIFSFPYSLFVYGINDYYDSKSDNLNNRKGGILGIKHDSRFKKNLPLFSFIGLIISFLGIFVLNFRVSLIFLIFLVTYLYNR